MIYSDDLTRLCPFRAARILHSEGDREKRPLSHFSRSAALAVICFHSVIHYRKNMLILDYKL